jgi:hypothetical protein
VETPVAEAPPEVAAPEISDELAEQMAEDATTPPPVEAAAPETLPENPTEQPKITEEPTTPDEASNEGPSQTIQNEIDTRASAEAQAPQLPKASNPARSAIIVAVFVIVALSVLAVFAFMSSQK